MGARPGQEGGCRAVIFICKKDIGTLRAAAERHEFLAGFGVFWEPAGPAHPQLQMHKELLL